MLFVYSLNPRRYKVVCACSHDSIRSNVFASQILTSQHLSPNSVTFSEFYAIIFRSPPTHSLQRLGMLCYVSVLLLCRLGVFSVPQPSM